MHYKQTIGLHGMRYKFTSSGCIVPHFLVLVILVFRVERRQYQNKDAIWSKPKTFELIATCCPTEATKSLK